MLTRIILIVTLLMLAGCRDEEAPSKSAEETRIEKEVKQRVEVVEKGLKVGQTRMRTIRITAFVLLAGGSIALFVRLQRQRGFHPTPTPERSLLSPDGWTTLRSPPLGSLRPIHRSPWTGNAGTAAHCKRPGIRQTPTVEETTEMRPRPVLELLIVMALIGLLMEITEGHTWVLVAAGAVAAVWLLARSH